MKNLSHFVPLISQYNTAFISFVAPTEDGKESALQQFVKNENATKVYLSSGICWYHRFCNVSEINKIAANRP